ncbi:MAG TPA: protein tyrosine phosphatase family protein [Polyangia bacterium]|nr:protein tyrosine phosphatase family protein [Polyangia bacterium]
MALTDIKNFLRVDERLGTGGQPTEAQLGDVAADGYAAVINLGLLDPKYCLPDEAGAVASLGLEYRHIPVRFDAPTVEDFRAFASTMDAWSGEKVFVHCAANFRVTAFVALYGELRLGWPRARAEALAQALWQPNDVWRAFIERCRAEVASQ